jgi:hypothetical protein
MPTARAEFTGPVLDPNILLQGEGSIWTQVFAALLIWVVFRLGRYLAVTKPPNDADPEHNHCTVFNCMGPAEAWPHGPNRRSVAIIDCCMMGNVNFLVRRSVWGAIHSGLVQDGTSFVSQGTPLMTAEGLRGGVCADNGQARGSRTNSDLARISRS